jgi:hypothetical protein
MANTTACERQRQWTRRPEDRRLGVHHLVRTLAEHVVSGDPEVRLYGLLESGVARLLGAVRASVVPARPSSLNRPQPSRTETAIPGPPHGRPLALEVDLTDRAPKRGPRPAPRRSSDPAPRCGRCAIESSAWLCRISPCSSRVQWAGSSEVLEPTECEVLECARAFRPKERARAIVDDW